MTDLDERIVRTLRERAEGDVDTDRLLPAAPSPGAGPSAYAVGPPRDRARRGGGARLVGVTGAALAASAGAAGRRPPPDAAAAAPPRRRGVPGAAARPDLVGTDPQVLHFGFDPARAATWLAGPQTRSRAYGLTWAAAGDGVARPRSHVSERRSAGADMTGASLRGLPGRDVDASSDGVIRR